MPEIYAITGAREMGKTLLCKKLAEKFSSSGLMVSGILSIKRTENRSSRKISTGQTK